MAHPISGCRMEWRWAERRLRGIGRSLLLEQEGWWAELVWGLALGYLQV